MDKETQLKFRISKIANQFFFITNLAEWDFSCRTEYSALWIEHTGPLNAEEKETLLAVKKIIQAHSPYHYEDGRSNSLWNCFYTLSSSSAWKRARLALTDSDYNQLKRAFNLFDWRFKRIWRRSNLQKDVSRLKQLSQARSCRVAIREMFHFLGLTDIPSQLEVVALMSPLSGDSVTAAGGANVDDRHITLEIPSLRPNTWELEHSLGVLIHEVGHIAMRIGAKAGSLVKNMSGNIRFGQNQRPFREILEETIIDCLAPSGFLAQHYFRFKPTTLFTEDMPRIFEHFLRFKSGRRYSPYKVGQYFVWQLYPITASYMGNKKTIDKAFVECVVNLLKR